MIRHVVLVCSRIFCQYMTARLTKACTTPMMWTSLYACAHITWAVIAIDSCFGLLGAESTLLRWLKKVSSTYIWMGRYNHSLPLDATIMVSKNCPIRFFHQSHNTVLFGGLFTLKQWIISTLKHDTVPRVNKLYCFYVKNPQNVLHYGIVKTVNHWWTPCHYLLDTKGYHSNSKTS